MQGCLAPITASLASSSLTMRLKAELKKLSEGNLAIGSGNKMDGPVTTVDDVLPKDAPAPNTGASQPAAKKASKPAKEGASAAPEAPARSKRDRQQVEFYTDNLKQSEAFTVQQVCLQTRMSPCPCLQSAQLLSQCLPAGQGVTAG